jgi:ribonuclease T2
MKRLLLIPALAFSLLSTAGTALCAQPGQFDYYVLSLSWQPTFCASEPEKKECVSETQERFDSKNLALHGLWPSVSGDKHHNYAYCGVSNKIKQQDHHNKWCQMPFPDIQRATFEKLGEVMPGCQSCLQNHEWYKHGVCSGIGADDFFATSTRLVKGVPETNLGRFVTENTGKNVRLTEIQAAAAKDFGDKSSRIRFICQNGMLSEVRLYLDKTLPVTGGIKPDMLVSPDANEKTTCSGNFKIKAVGD